MNLREHPIYMDYNATTPVDPRVMAAMQPYFMEQFGNAVSLNRWGWMADEALNKARSQVAHLLGAKISEIFFTSGATESNNWVVRGLIEYTRSQNPNEKIHLLTTQVEHSSVYESFVHMSQIYPQVTVDFIAVDNKGQIDLKDLENKITPHTKLVAVMSANNEIGTIYPTAKISEICQKHQVAFLCDATQSAGKLPLNLQNLKVDFLTFSAHKIYGPKGVGVLYRKGNQTNLLPLIKGGGQEHEQRAGTQNVAGIVGLGAACEIAQNESRDDFKKLYDLRLAFIQNLKEKLAPNGISIRINGDTESMNPGTINLTFLNTQVPRSLPLLGCSRGSACHTDHTVASRVLTAIGLSNEDAQNTLRFSLGRFSTQKDVEEASEYLATLLKPLKAKT